MSKAEEIISLCLKIDEYLKTINKSLDFDEMNSEAFENHYAVLIEETIKSNWEIRNLAQQLTRDDFHRNLKLPRF